MKINTSLLNYLTFTDDKIESGVVYHYFVTAVFEDGESAPSNVIEVEIGTSEDDREDVLRATTLLGNFPNPFNPSTTLMFSIETPSMVSVLIEVYNIRGQRVTTLVDEYKSQGVHSVIWDGTDSSGQFVSSGIYFSRMTAGEITDFRKMILMK